MSENMKVLEAMMAASKRKDHDAFLDTLADEFEYHWRMGQKPIRDRATMLKFIRNYEAGFDQQAWIVLNWAERDGVILVEGLEKLYDRANDQVIDNPFMQAIEFRDGKICKLRDYYDSARFETPASKENAA